MDTVTTSATTSTTTSRQEPREARLDATIVSSARTKPTHDGSAIDVGGGRGGLKRRRKRTKAERQDTDDDEIDAFATSREWLAEAREKLLPPSDERGGTGGGGARGDATWSGWGRDVRRRTR